MGAKARVKVRAKSVVEKLLPAESGGCGADRGTQHLLSVGWRNEPGLDLRDVEFRNFSQNGEDGILLYLLARAGHGTRRAVELCAGDGIESNTANLVIHHGWDVLMIDGDPALIERGKDFFSRHQETYRVGPTLVAEWVTRDNVNAVLEQHGYNHDVDVLSIDMDGVDYWILDAIHLDPRIVVVEYNVRIPAGVAVTVPYGDSFTAAGGAFSGDGFFGASLSAFDNLLSARGYRLVGANRHNTNAFFLRADVIPDRPSVSVESCMSSRWAVTHRSSWLSLADRPWVEV